MENYTKGTIADVSRRDMLAEDPYYGLANSFQYSENINCDDELHGIKLSQRIMRKNNTCENSQLICAGNRVFVVPTEPGERVKYFDKSSNPNGEDDLDLSRFPGGTINDTLKTSTLSDRYVTVPSQATVGEAVIFQDNLRVSWFITDNTGGASTFTTVNVQSLVVGGENAIYDHLEDSDESISDINSKNGPMLAGVNQVINFNNTRLVCGVGTDLWVYYPELDMAGQQMYDRSTGTTRLVVFGETGWKRVQRFEAGCEIVGLTCDFEYLKVWVRDEGWNTKMYYYPGNNDLRNTFVYNIIDMTGTKVLKTYNINGIDYFTASLDGTDGYITFNKVIGDTPVQIFKQRGGLTKYDVNQKAGYFVGPTSRAAEYHNGDFYIADAYGVFKFAFNPTGYDTGYLKRKARNVGEVTTGLCIAWNFVFISDETGLKAMRLYDTGIDGYESKGILISREMEGDYGGCVAKIVDELRCHFELNNLKRANGNYRIPGADLGEIEIYLSPNNTWQNADPDIDDTGWYKIVTLDYKSRETRYEKVAKASGKLEFDRETITYCVVIRSGDELAQRTPVVREVSIAYHLKGKANEVYELNNGDNG